ncbi:GMC family oxidoreductase [Pseudomonas sp. NPDC089996]|uniref:GMC family oxidoreductase n=1 Tax=Pseudomonas sp. NPDC089996 TaxID=3364474 RepID=UPI003815516F
MHEVYDYIVIGAGSAGCTLAARLADSGPETIALLESGGSNLSAKVDVPMGLALTATRQGQMNYGFRSVAQPALGGRTIFTPRGKGVGGSSAINGMLYLRGAPADYDGWAQQGCEGWSWREVLPYFRRAECNERVAGSDDDPWHGGSGPLQVVDQRSPGAFARYFVEAAAAAGHCFNPDFNGEKLEGAGFYQVTQRDGERWGVARAYLHGGKAAQRGLNGGRSNLSVQPGTRTLRILFDGTRATGVLVWREGKAVVLRARREVILSAGVIGSPQLLMLSGIGPAAHLIEQGITPLVDAPQVGQNLQEHVDILLHRRLFSTDLVGTSLPGIVRLLWEMRRYRRHRTGMLTRVFTESGAFLKTESGLADPDVQLHFVMASAEPTGKPLLYLPHGYAIHVCVLRPHSRGSVRLASKDAHDAPLIDLGLLSDERDLQTLEKGVHLVKRILDQPALSRFGGKLLHFDHLKFDHSAADQQALREVIRNKANTIFHSVGTCRMGADLLSVVDPQLRVRGVTGLRVVDASIMPTIVRGNTNAPAIMIGEKAADLIRAAQGPDVGPAFQAMHEKTLG